jgi:hypothetical protein
MSSSANWKKYGGINKNEKMNNLNVTSIVTDSLTLRNAYTGAFDICGNVTISEKLYVNKKTSFNDNIYVRANVDISKNVIIDGNILVNGNSTFTNAQSVFNNIVYLGEDKAQYLYGNPNGIGVNILNPNATLDICGNRVEVLNVFSDLSTNRNIIARNINKQGIVVSVDNSYSTIDFFNDASINPLNRYDGRIQYQKKGIMIIDVSDNTYVASKLSVSNRDASAHVLGETAVIYDICNNTYAYDVYDISSSNTGNALSLIASDNSSNTFLNIINPSKNGLSIGGGAYPLDASKAMGTIGLCDASGVYRPTQNIVRGSSTVKYKTTLGINTHVPRIDKYVVDINGPMHLTNGELTNVSSNNFQINNIVFSRTNKNHGLAFGAPYSFTPGTPPYDFAQQILYTRNGGISWSKSRIVDNFDPLSTHRTDLELTYNEFNSGYMYDQNYAIIGGDKGFLFYTNDGGETWNNITFANGINSSIKGLYIGERDSSPSTDYKRFVVLYSSAIIVFDLTLTKLNTDINSTINITIGDDEKKNFTNGESFKSMHGYGNYLYIVGDSIFKYDIISKTAAISHTLPNFSYNSVYAYDNNYVIAVGDRIISYTKNGGSTWTNITTNTLDLAIESITLNSVYILNANNAIAVGNNGIIVYTSDGAVTWKTAANDITNSSGNGNTLVNSNYELNGIVMQDLNTFLVSTLIRPLIRLEDLSIQEFGKTNIMYCFFPNLMNRVNNYVFDVSGNMGMDGDIRINSGTIMIKDATPSTSATTGALQVTGGAGIVGNTYIDGNLVVNSSTDPETDGIRGALTIPTGGMYIGGNVEIGGNVIFRKELKVIGETDNAKDATFNSGTETLQTLDSNNKRVVKGSIMVTNGGGVYISGNTYCGGQWLDVENDVNIKNVLNVLNILNSKNVSVTATENSDNLQSGALKVTEGGASIRKNTHIGGNLKVYTNSIIEGTSSFTGASTFLNNMQVDGNVFFDNTTDSGNTTTGTLVVKGGVGIDKNLHVGGTTFIRKTTAATSSVDAALVVYGGVGIGNNIFVTGNSRISGNSTIDQNCTISRNAIVTGNIRINSDENNAVQIQNGGLYITGAFPAGNSTTGALQIPNGGASIGGNLFVNGNTSSNISDNGSLVVKGGVGISENIHIGGRANIAGNTNVTGDINLVGIARLGNSAVSNVYNNGSLVVSGGVGIAGNVNIGANNISTTNTINGNVIITGNVNSNDYTNQGGALTGTLLVEGGVGIRLNTSIQGKLLVNNDTFSSNTQSGALTVWGGAGINDNINVRTTANIGGNTTINSGGESTSPTSGALVISSKEISGVTYKGGLGVAGNVNIGGGSTSANSTSGSLVVTGGVGISENINVGGLVTIVGNAIIRSETQSTSSGSGALIIGNAGARTGGLGVGGSVFIGGDVSSGNSVTGSLVVTGGVGISQNINVGSLATIVGNTIIRSETQSTSSGSGALIIGNAGARTGGLGVGGSVFIGGDVSSGNSVSGSLVVTGGVGISQNINVGGLATIVGNTIIRSGTQSISSGSGALIIGNSVAKTGGLGVGGSVFIGGDVSSANSISGSLVVTGGVGISQNINVGGLATIVGNTIIRSGTQSISSGSGALIIGNAGARTGGLGVGGSVFIGGDVSSGNSVTGSLVVTGGVGISQNINVGGLATIVGNTIIRSGTQSISSGSGALIIGNAGARTGGLGVGGSVFIGGDVSSGNSVTGSLVVTGGVGISGSMFIQGNASATAYYATSDYRIKSNVKKLDHTFSIDKLEPVSYFNDISQRDDVGFIAHKVEEIYPFLVYGEKDAAEYQTLNYNGIIGILVREIQELKHKVNELENLW